MGAEVSDARPAALVGALRQGTPAAARRARVAAIIDTSSVSGPGRQLAALGAALAEHGVELRVFTFQRSGKPVSPFPAFLERTRVSCEVIPDSGPADLGLVMRLRAALKTWAPDVVQTHGYRPTTLMSLLRRTGSRWPWIAFFHGTTNENLKVRAYNWLDHRLLRRADRVVVMSSRYTERFARTGATVDVVYNATIPLVEDPASVATTRDKLAALSGAVRPMLGVVGRLSPEKGVDVFLQAVALLAARGLQFSAVIAGDGPERERLLQLRATLGLEQRVTFVGALSAVQPLYAAIDLVVLPSRSEGLPNVMLEGLLAGLPVVATDVGAVREVLGSSAAGVVVPPDAPAALADAIVAGLALRDSPRAAADRASVVLRFSVTRRASEMSRIYREVVAGAQA